MHKQKFSSAKFSQKGAVLLEALIAILIFSMGILALVGLQAAMLQNTTDSKFRADASYLAQQQIGRIWADPANAASYVISNSSLAPALPGGLLTISQPVAGQFRVVVGWTSPMKHQQPRLLGAVFYDSCTLLYYHCQYCWGLE